MLTNPWAASSPNVTVRSTLDLNATRQTEVLAFAFNACKIDGHCLGWLPRKAYVGSHEAGRMICCHNNNDLVGYMIFGFDLYDMRVYHTWVRRDARLILHGRAMVEHCNALAFQKGAANIALWCAEDLPANIFWGALGFINTNWRWGKAKKPRRHLGWQRPVYDPRRDELILASARSPATASAARS